jgi:hypothetical protein
VSESDLVRRLVLNSIADDYENVDQVILRQVGEAEARIGLTIQRSDIVDALATLIRDGLAKAYLLSSREPSRELQGMPTLDVIETNFETYFYITENGIDVLSKDTWRPFDDECEPR